MKKLISTLGVVLMATFILSSCSGGDVESDAKKVAELQCKATKLMQKASSGDVSVLEESQKLSTEAAALAKEMEGKYTTDEEKTKFGEALLKEQGNCK